MKYLGLDTEVTINDKGDFHVMPIEVYDVDVSEFDEQVPTPIPSVEEVPEPVPTPMEEAPVVARTTTDPMDPDECEKLANSCKPVATIPPRIIAGILSTARRSPQRK